MSTRISWGTATGALLALTLVLATYLAHVSAMMQHRDRRLDIIEWPDRRFGSIQGAIDALPDGGTLRFTEAVVRVEEPLFIRGKRIVIEGNGCDEQKTRPQGGTHLVGPRTETLAEFDAVRALINFGPPPDDGVAGGGTVRNLKLSGFDAGIRAASGAGAVVVEKVCITDTGRGVAWSATASLSLRKVLIRDIAWNGASITAATALAGAFVHFADVTILNVAGACVYYQNVQAVVVGALFNFCGSTATIAALNSNLYVADTTIAGSNGPGIALSGGSAFITETFVNQASGFGILLHNVVHGDIEDVHIKDTKAFSSGPQAGLYGDAVTVVGGPANGPVWVTDSFLETAAHSGVANYGAFVSIGDLNIQCTLFHVEGEVLGTKNFVYSDLGGMKCGCPTASGVCQAVSAVSASAPGPPMTTP